MWYLLPDTLPECTPPMPKIMDLIETERFLLHRLEYRDEELYVSIHTDAILMENAGGAAEEVSARAAFDRLLKYAELPDLKQHAWLIKQKLEPTGPSIGVTAIAAHGADVEMGIMVVQAWQGLKVAQEVLSNLTEHAFGVHAARRVFTRHLAQNMAGAGVMKRLGFELMPDVPDAHRCIGWVKQRQGSATQRGSSGS